MSAARPGGTRLALVWALVAVLPACPGSDANEPAGGAERPVVEGSEWLRGETDARFALVAKHLRGLDVAMVEVGYRYGELYWAGRDRNWEYAAYQLGKIETAVANGVERRPRRAVSARMLEDAVEGVRAAIGARDGGALDAALETLTTTCNECHRAEGVAFIPVTPPALRASPTRPPGGAGAPGTPAP